MKTHEEPAPPPGWPDEPDGIGGAERAIWQRTCRTLEDQKTLTCADGAMIERYCKLRAAFDALCKQITNEGFTISRIDHLGCVIRSESAESRVMLKISAQLHKLEVELGLSPASRSRVKTAKGKLQSAEAAYAKLRTAQ